MSEEEIQKLPPPVLLSVIICDMVIIDRITDKPSIIGAFETISAPQYPARHPRLALFCQLTNGHGKAEITVRLVDVQQEDKTLFKGTVEHKFRDVREVSNLTFDIGGIVFPHSGEYRLQVYTGTEFLGERRVICRQIELPTGGKSNE
ncbi:MAG: hypothetical protein AMJ75_03760 [Phycisphaerae bacterium SM1_79]|nr:MAG: hypothetical protein AMJ75_03760 [Phycisphaerae bacterium SM1_79]